MGVECFNGHNIDNDLPIESPKQKKLNSKRTNYKNYQYNYLQIKNNTKYNSAYTQIEGYNTLSPNSRENYANHKINKTISQNKRSNSYRVINSGKQKNIHNFTYEELQDQVNDILRIRVPFFENSILKTLSSFTILSGNGPYHEGLLFFTTNKNFYIAQSYPITFIRVFDYFHGIKEIISFNNINKNSKKYHISEIYCPQEPITLYDVLNIINNLPNKYNLLNENCQNFCSNILKALTRNFQIEMDDKNNVTKINFLKKQRKYRLYKIPHYKGFANSGRYDNI